MDKYIGAKLIQAEPERNPVTKEITGYKVVYPDGYESWSPKDVFEKAYMKVDDNKNLPSGVSIGPEMVGDIRLLFPLVFLPFELGSVYIYLPLSFVSGFSGFL